MPSAGSSISAQAAKDFHGKLGLAVGLGGVRRHPLLGELPQGVAELALLVGQGKVRVRHPDILAELIGCSGP